MSASFVTLDQGNSRLKLVAWVGAPDARAAELAVDTRLELATDRVSPERLERFLGERRALAGLALASVAPESARESLRRALRKLSAAPLHEPPAGLENRCREPQRVGLDRLFAARGTLALFGCSAIVVDVGTALTVDAVAAGAANCAAPGTFLGGAIAPGPAVLARALAEATAQLPHVAPRAGVPALGRVTEEAIASGIVHGLRGAARELAREVAREAGFRAAPVALTGGARELLLDPAPCFDAERLLVAPDLVHRGLLEAAWSPA